MPGHWKQYQQDVALFFRRFGFDVKVEEIVLGVRGKHSVDVLVVGETYGLSFRWVIECKYWKSNIPKEKVMVLLSIVQDVGADRGFLLSEKGFQSGATRAAKKTNITLTSLENLEFATQEILIEKEISNLLFRKNKIYKRLRELHKQTDDYYSHFAEPMGQILCIDFAINDAIKGNYPVLCATRRNGERIFANNWSSLVEKLTKLLDYAEEYTNRYE